MQEAAEALRGLQPLRQAGRHVRVPVARDHSPLPGDEQRHLLERRVGPREVGIAEGDEGRDVKRGPRPCPRQPSGCPRQVGGEEDHEVEPLREQRVALGSPPRGLHRNGGAHVEANQAIKRTILLQELAEPVHGLLEAHPVLEQVVDAARLDGRTEVPIHPVVRAERPHELGHLRPAVPLPRHGVGAAEVLDLDVLPPGPAAEARGLLEDVLHLRHAAPVVGAAPVHEDQLEPPCLP
mmetsp:Transcript_72614/g.216760  ORF Transcript_72614/g.216760 Transcript_72614/m.216760 type:complete len:237 (-) Transcript_72614:212-922(-)